jgi:hypothetical protein
MVAVQERGRDVRGFYRSIKFSNVHTPWGSLGRFEAWWLLQISLADARLILIGSSLGRLPVFIGT